MKLSEEMNNFSAENIHVLQKISSGYGFVDMTIERKENLVFFSKEPGIN